MHPPPPARGYLDEDLLDITLGSVNGKQQVLGPSIGRNFGVTRTLSQLLQNKTEAGIAPEDEPSGLCVFPKCSHVAPHRKRRLATSLPTSQLGVRKIVLARAGRKRPWRKFMGQLFLTLCGQAKYSKEKAKKRRAMKIVQESSCFY